MRSGLEMKIGQVPAFLAWDFERRRFYVQKNVVFSMNKTMIGDEVLQIREIIRPSTWICGLFSQLS